MQQSCVFCAGVEDDGWPRGLRPLGMLAVLARGDAVAGQGSPPAVSPGRMVRMIWHRFRGN